MPSRVHAVPMVLATDVVSSLRAQVIVPAPEMTFGTRISRSVGPDAVSVGTRSSRAKQAAFAG